MNNLLRQLSIKTRLIVSFLLLNLILIGVGKLLRYALVFLLASHIF